MIDDIFDHADDAIDFAQSVGYKKMDISLLLSSNEVSAILSGKFIVCNIEGIGVVIGKEDSFEQEYQNRMKKISDDAIAEYEKENLLEARKKQKQSKRKKQESEE